MSVFTPKSGHMRRVLVLSSRYLGTEGLLA